MNNAGIYEIVNIVNGKRYVGSAVNLAQRKAGHVSDLRKGKHHSRYLQRSWNKRGPDVFVFKTMLICSKENLLMYEQRAIDAFLPEYNTAKTAGSQLGIKRTQETLAKMSASRLGVKLPPRTAEQLARLSLSMLGHKVSPATRAKISASQLGVKRRPLSTETRAKLSEAKKGKKLRPLSQEHRAKLSAANRGKTPSAEHRSALSAAMRGRKPSPECLAAALRANTGRAASAETLAKLSAARRGRPWSAPHRAAYERSIASRSRLLAS